MPDSFVVDRSLTILPLGDGQLLDGVPGTYNRP